MTRVHTTSFFDHHGLKFKSLLLINWIHTQDLFGTSEWVPSLVYRIRTVFYGKKEMVNRFFDSSLTVTPSSNSYFQDLSVDSLPFVYGVQNRRSRASILVEGNFYNRGYGVNQFCCYCFPKEVPPVTFTQTLFFLK